MFFLEVEMTVFDRLFLLATGLLAIYLIYYFFVRAKKENNLYDKYYLLGIVVLLVSGLLLIFFGWDILASPYVLTVASLIPLGISLGIANQFYPQWKKAFSWFALIGILAIGVTSIFDLSLKKLAVPLFHGVAGMIIFLGPIFSSQKKKAPKDFWWVGVGGVLIGLGGIALGFLSLDRQLLFFSNEFVFNIRAPLLFFMTLAFTWGFSKDLK